MRRPHRDAGRQAPLCPHALCDDRRSLRSHHRRAVVRPGSALEAAARRAGRARRRARARSIWRPAPATSRSRSRRPARRVVGLDVTLRMIELAQAKAPSAAAAPRFLVGDMLALPFPGRLVRPRDDRLRPAERAGSDDGDRRDPARAEAGRPGAVARLQPPGQRAASARRICAYLTDRGRRARLAAASRSGYLSLHSGVDPQLSRAPPAWRG